MSFPFYRCRPPNIFIKVKILNVYNIDDWSNSGVSNCTCKIARWSAISILIWRPWTSSFAEDLHEHSSRMSKCPHPIPIQPGVILVEVTVTIHAGRKGSIIKIYNDTMKANHLQLARGNHHIQHLDAFVLRQTTKTITKSSGQTSVQQEVSSSQPSPSYPSKKS